MVKTCLGAVNSNIRYPSRFECGIRFLPLRKHLWSVKKVLSESVEKVLSEMDKNKNKIVVILLNNKIQTSSLVIVVSFSLNWVCSVFGIEPTKSVMLNSAVLVQTPGQISRRIIVYVRENIVPITVDTTQPLFQLSIARIKTTAIAWLSLPSQWTNNFLNQNTSNAKKTLWELWKVQCLCFKTVLSNCRQKEGALDGTSFTSGFDVSSICCRLLPFCYTQNKPALCHSLGVVWYGK